MAYLKIIPGIGTLSNSGRPLPGRLHRPTSEIKQEVFARDDHTCRYCGFRAEKYQDVNFIGKSDSSAPSVDDYATACIFCSQCFQLDRVQQMQSGTIVWLPEIGQAALHHICRAIYVARVSQGPMADAARDVMDVLMQRKKEAVSRLGTDNPQILSTVLKDFMEPSEYKNRAGKFKGFCLLPLDRRIIQEGDLEFNQFPQVLAYWRSKDGPFGVTPPRTWIKHFYDLQQKVSQPAVQATTKKPPPVVAADEKA